MICDWWSCSHFEECKSRLLFSGAKYPPCASCVHFDFCDVCTEYVKCADLIVRYFPNIFRRLVLEIQFSDKNCWDCVNFEECKLHLLFNGAKYPPCVSCVHFDTCDFCSKYIDCAELVTRYLPDMFRRLVRDIRLGEDTTRTCQFINRNTLGGRKRR